jgi:hypothetical protein
MVVWVIRRLRLLVMFVVIIICLLCPPNRLCMFVMPIGKARVINCLFLFLIVFPHHHLSWCCLMYGVLPLALLVIILIMFPSLMILASSHGSTYLSINLRFFRNIMFSRLMLNDFLIAKFWPCKLTGVASTIS